MLNALDALSLEENGKKKKRIHVDICREGEFLRVSIEDNGSGIAPEHLSRVFDPFFTTKPVGSGTGLGLSISQNIIHAYSGEITCESVLGEGTKFRILLPIE
jgi:signal transduction histidine kinase